MMKRYLLNAKLTLNTDLNSNHISNSIFNCIPNRGGLSESRADTKIICSSYRTGPGSFILSCNQEADKATAD